LRAFNWSEDMKNLQRLKVATGLLVWSSAMPLYAQKATGAASSPDGGASQPVPTPDVRIIDPTWFVAGVVVALVIGFFIGRSTAPAASANRLAR
jgi:hypothetical protein